MKRKSNLSTLAAFMKASQIQVVFTTVVSDKITTFTESYHSSHLIHFGGLVLAHFPYFIISSNTIQKKANLHLLVCHLSFNIPTKYPYILSSFQDLTYYEVQPTQYPYILSYFQILKLDGNRYQPSKTYHLHYFPCPTLRSSTNICIKRQMKRKFLVD